MSEKTLSALQKEAADILGDDLKHPRVGATLALVEELGELVKEIVEIEIYRQPDAREKLQDEVGDVLFSLFEVCTAYDISLQDAYDRKVAKILTKVDSWREQYSANLRELRAKLD
jgi:NTP pyrophosphatase (non-canonical NTP hydrolase)